jgi:hypothetical protein
MRSSLFRLLPVALILGATVILGLSQQLYLSPEVVVTWETESELDTAGFHLYRSDSPAGPFVRATDQLIPGSSDPNTGGSYSFRDKQVESGRTYYYELEDIDSSGTSTRHGPIVVTAAGCWNLYVIGGLLGFTLIGLWSARRSPMQRHLIMHDTREG